MQQLQLNQERDEVLSYTMSYVKDDDWNDKYCAWESLISDLVNMSENEPPTEIFLIYVPQEKSTRCMNFGQWQIGGRTLFKYFDISFLGYKFDGDEYCYENGAAAEQQHFEWRDHGDNVNRRGTGQSQSKMVGLGYR